MRGASHPIPVALALLSGIVAARGANETVPPGQADAGWVVSETTSPVDYSPIATAIVSSPGGADGAAMQLAIRCRGGRTEVAVTGPAFTGRGDSYFISYRVNGGQPVQLGGAASAFGDGV